MLFVSVFTLRQQYYKYSDLNVSLSSFLLSYNDVFIVITKTRISLV